MIIMLMTIIQKSSCYTTQITKKEGHTMVKVVSYHPVTAETQFNPNQVHMGFVVD
jgi:hypothetical protein